MNINILLALFSILTINMSIADQNDKEESSVTPVGVNLDTLIFQIYNDFVSKDQEYVIDIFSPNYIDILGFQFAFELKDVEFVSVEGHSINMNPNYYNYKSDVGQLLVSFSDANPVSFQASDILFSIRVKAKKSVFIKDIISVKDDILMSEAIYLSFDSSPIRLSFDFIERTSSTNNRDLELVKIYPNQFQVGKMIINTVGINALEASLYSFSGAYIDKLPKVAPNSFETNIVSKGMYIIKVYDGLTYHTELLTIH